MMNTLSRSACVNRDGEFGDRFWYWRGASGRTYIHSIYDADGCPPVPGAVYIAVRRDRSGRRVPLGVGRLPATCGMVIAVLPGMIGGHGPVDEIHVHLLAEEAGEAAAVAEDLRAALAPEAAFAPDAARDRPAATPPSARPRRRSCGEAGAALGAQLNLWPSVDEAGAGAAFPA